MTVETVQFIEMVREHYARIEAEKLAAIERLVQIMEDERAGKLTPEQAKRLRMGAVNK